MTAAPGQLRESDSDAMLSSNTMFSSVPVSKMSFVAVFSVQSPIEDHTLYLVIMF